MDDIEIMQLLKKACLGRTLGKEGAMPGARGRELHRGWIVWTNALKQVVL